MRQTFDKEKISLNVARMKTHGENFEVVIDPDNAVNFRHGKADIREALKSENIFKDAIKGERASEQHMKEIFGTTDTLKIAEKLIKDGSIQINDEYREKLRKEKGTIIIGILIKNAVNTKTGKPVTATEINNALNQAKINFDMFKSAEDQVDEIVDKLRPVLPLTFEKKILEIRIPSNNAAKLYGFVTSKTQLVDEAWLSDGAWSCKAEIAAGMANDFIDELKSKTHGDVEVSVESKVEEKKNK